MFTYFSWSSDAQLKSKFDLESFTEVLMSVSPQVGANMPLSALNALVSQFGYRADKAWELVAENHEEGLECYRLPEDFPGRLTILNNEVLAEISRRWAEEDVFGFPEVNGFDLYGFLIELRELSKSPLRGRNFYAVCSFPSRLCKGSGFRGRSEWFERSLFAGGTTAVSSVGERSGRRRTARGPSLHWACRACGYLVREG